MVALVADDSFAYRKIAQRALEDSGIGFERITCVMDGQQAMEALRAGGYDLILADINMPVMGGLELLAAVRSDVVLCSLPFIIVSGQTTREHVLRALSLGASGCLQKPFSAKQVAKLIVDVTQIKPA